MYGTSDFHIVQCFFPGLFNSNIYIFVQKYHIKDREITLFWNQVHQKKLTNIVRIILSMVAQHTTIVNNYFCDRCGRIEKRTHTCLP